MVTDHASRIGIGIDVVDARRSAGASFLLNLLGVLRKLQFPGSQSKAKADPGA